MKKILFSIIFLLLITGLSAQMYPDSRTDGKYYTINGSKIWTVSFGKGDPLFIIPGGPGYAHIGMREFDSLSDISTLIYYDGFGRGKSDTAKNVKEYTLMRDINDLEELRKAFGFHKINILSHSYGTVVAQGYAIKYPENVGHLILISPIHSNVMWQENDDNSNREIRTSFPEIWDSLMIIRKQGYRSSDYLHQEIYNRVPLNFLFAYNPETNFNRITIPYPNRFNTRLYYQMVGKDGDFIVENEIAKFDFRNELKDLNMPILIIAGRYDRIAVPRMMVKYKEYCPNAKFYMFEKSGHRPFIEEPEKTFKIVRDFLTH